MHDALDDALKVCVRLVGSVATSFGKHGNRCNANKILPFSTKFAVAVLTC